MTQLICHCFGYTSDDIQKDVLKNGRSTIFERILNEKKSGECRCADKNPNGR
ncbi:hypothetical protein [Maridesulfovibrio salexigens]|uniref:BFD-like (2Fe-2S) protein n=1 Tax=Maridesulfovibrio salexigens (strain ATCC 14822 / DSM 2638 / NCIMB 8403 / VKM B-1763) TaxID=526222 RepID=C6C110_MARSD|nr:hypothetical protein [Maridesulfovibrio salexigens]ACS79173.1 conserved hypothetical protein [Maridesulfovibrio salexigens DSM 2638]